MIFFHIEKTKDHVGEVVLDIKQDFNFIYVMLRTSYLFQPIQLEFDVPGFSQVQNSLGLS